VASVASVRLVSASLASLGQAPWPPGSDVDILLRIIHDIHF
jgi:hypothetical protein